MYVFELIWEETRNLQPELKPNKAECPVIDKSSGLFTLSEKEFNHESDLN